MPAGSEVWLRVRKGSKYSANPVLLVNMPQEGADEDECSGEEEKKVEDTFGVIGDRGGSSQITVGSDGGPKYTMT